MMKRDFTYCKGHRCAIKGHCTRYVEGQRIPQDEADDYWWMEDCGDERTGLISTGV